MSIPRLAAAVALIVFFGTPAGRAEKEAGASDGDALARGTQDFALALHAKLRTTDGNLFYSPYSISEAMAMAATGARGVTAEELGAGMRFGVVPARLPAACQALREEIARPTRRRWPHGEPLRLRIANGLWAQEGIAFRPAYVARLREAFAAEARTADFRGAAEAARADINGWVREKTEKRIPELIAPDSLGADTMLVLVNAVWFEASWRFPFDPDRTSPEPFTRLDGTRIPVPTMRLAESFRYARGEGWELVELPYARSHAAMTILLPAEGQLAGLEERLDAQRLRRYREKARQRSVRLHLPRIRVRSRLALSDVLASMGMPSAFGAGADFGGMTEDERLFISQVVHEATLDVDEYGTEAAAATAVVMEKGRPPEPVDMHVDRPFLVVIHDTTTGAILFLGRIVDPVEAA